MRSRPGLVRMLLPLVLCLTSTPTLKEGESEIWLSETCDKTGLPPVCFGAAIPVSCGSIYKSFAQCLVTLGDSLVEREKDQNTQDIDAICRSWNAFHVCASSALKGCPGEAAAVWESLRQESRKAQFSGNLYDMCASRTTLPPTTVPAPQGPPTSDQTNQETLKGQTYKHNPAVTTLLFPVCSTLLAFKT